MVEHIVNTGCNTLKAGTMPITKFEQDGTNTLNTNTIHEKKIYTQKQKNNDILKTQPYQAHFNICMK